MTAEELGKATEVQDDKRKQRRGLLAWFLLVLFSICILFSCAQLAGLSILNPPQSVDLRSRMQADYSPWGFVAFGPINPQILGDLLGDLHLARDPSTHLEHRLFDPRLVPDRNPDADGRPTRSRPASRPPPARPSHRRGRRRSPTPSPSRPRQPTHPHPRPTCIRSNWPIRRMCRLG